MIENTPQKITGILTQDAPIRVAQSIQRVCMAMGERQNIKTKLLAEKIFPQGLNKDHRLPERVIFYDSLPRR